MSYILDALKRAESERGRGAVPNIHAQPDVVGDGGGRGAGWRQTARTSLTSGTKWRSRFSIPCFSVAVEEGQLLGIRDGQASRDAAIRFGMTRIVSINTRVSAGLRYQTVSSSVTSPANEMAVVGALLHRF